MRGKARDRGRAAGPNCPAVRLAAVIGIPDPLRTEIVKVFVVPHDDIDGGEGLVNELQSHVKSRLSAHEYPRQIEFVASLPMTATGKIIRRLLRHQDAGNS